MRIHIAIATTGRPVILRQVVDRCMQQTRPADGMIVVGAAPDDVHGLVDASPTLKIIIAPRGLCKQRNSALEFLTGKTDVVVFFDDDFVPAHNCLESLERIFSENSEIVGVTGQLVADGAQTSPIDFDDAVARLDVEGDRPPPGTEACSSLYGCNMAIRLSAAQGLRFDENLPLYGWQEDVDFTRQLGWRGTMIRTSEITGVHLGARSGKTSGLRLGYSQVANIVYLSRKGTMRHWLCETLMFRNIIANLVRSLWPERDIDRLGRFIGNLMAIRDLCTGKIHPQRIETI